MAVGEFQEGGDEAAFQCARKAAVLRKGAPAEDASFISSTELSMVN